MTHASSIDSDRFARKLLFLPSSTLQTQMANRRGTKEVARDPDEFDFLASQQSPRGSDSDDQALEAALAKHYAAAKEKKKKEKETKFLQAAAKQMSKEIARPAEAVRECVKTMEVLYSNFILEYATSEDKINKLWTNIREEQETLLAVVEKRQALNVACSEKTEEGQIEGLYKTKTACQDFQVIIDKLVSEQ